MQEFKSQVFELLNSVSSLNREVALCHIYVDVSIIFTFNFLLIKLEYLTQGSKLCKLEAMDLTKKLLCYLLGNHQKLMEGLDGLRFEKSGAGGFV